MKSQYSTTTQQVSHDCDIVSCVSVLLSSSSPPPSEQLSLLPSLLLVLSVQGCCNRFVLTNKLSSSLLSFLFMNCSGHWLLSWRNFTCSDVRILTISALTLSPSTIGSTNTKSPRLIQTLRRNLVGIDTRNCDPVASSTLCRLFPLLASTRTTSCLPVGNSRSSRSTSLITCFLFVARDICNTKSKGHQWTSRGRYR